MDREMLLESNNIHFEPTLQNVRKMATKLFGSTEQPVTDELSLNNSNMDKKSVSIAGPSHDDAGKNEDSWRDVENIFENLNNAAITSSSSEKLSNEIEDVSQFNDLKTNQNNKIVHNQNSKTARDEIDTVQTGQNMQHNVLSANKENIFDSNDCIITDRKTSQDPLPSSDLSGQKYRIKKETIQAQNGHMVSSQVSEMPSGLKHLPPVPSLNVSNRVRQVNVEMFTISLKRDQVKEGAENVNE